MRYVILSLIAPVALLVGCADAGSSPPAARASTAPGPALARFRARLDRASHSLAIQRVSRGTLGAGPTVQSVDPIPDPGGANGSPAEGDVDLVSANCVDGYPATPTFQCDVEVRANFPQALSNVVVQIDSSTLDGVSTNAYDGSNSDTTNPLGLPVAHGLWTYTNYTESPTAGPYFFTRAADGFNTGTRTWTFLNPDDANVVWDIVVYASKGFSRYTRGPANPGLSGHVDACAGGTSVTSATRTGIALPFDFTIYDTHATTVNVAGNGQMTFGATSLTESGSSLALPTTSAPHPAFFAFWDDLGSVTPHRQRNPPPAAQMCFRTLGDAPNRRFVVEWRGYDFLTPPGGPGLGASLDFETFLFEGSSEIDTVYETMTGDVTSAGRENGALATVGLQDETGTVATADHDVSELRSGQSWSYQPVP